MPENTEENINYNIIKTKHRKHYLNSLLLLFSHQQFCFPPFTPMISCHFSQHMSNSLKLQPPEKAGQDFSKWTVFHWKA